MFLHGHDGEIGMEKSLLEIQLKPTDLPTRTPVGIFFHYKNVYNLPTVPSSDLV